MNQEKEQLKIEKQILNMTYIGFWKRFGANILDSLILFPPVLVFAILEVRLKQSGSYLFFGVNVLISIISYFYMIFFYAKFGATPGKMICKIKVTKEDGTALTLKQAFMRELINIIYTVISYICEIAALIYFFNATEIHHADMYQSFFNKSIFWKIQMFFMYAINLADFICFLTNSKKQALHDKIAKTIVVYKNGDSLNQRGQPPLF